MWHGARLRPLLESSDTKKGCRLAGDFKSGHVGMTGRPGGVQALWEETKERHTCQMEERIRLFLGSSCGAESRAANFNSL